MPFNFVGHYCMWRNDALWSLVFAVGRSLSLSLSLSMVIFRRPSCLLGSFSLIIPNNGKLARSNVRTVVSRVKKQIKATSICNLSKPASSIHESLFIIRALSLIFPPSPASELFLALIFHESYVHEIKAAKQARIKAKARHKQSSILKRMHAYQIN